MAVFEHKAVPVLFAAFEHTAALVVAFEHTAALVVYSVFHEAVAGTNVPVAVDTFAVVDTAVLAVVCAADTVVLAVDCKAVYAARTAAPVVLVDTAVLDVAVVEIAVVV